MQHRLQCSNMVIETNQGENMKNNQSSLQQELVKIALESLTENFGQILTKDKENVYCWNKETNKIKKVPFSFIEKTMEEVTAKLGES